MPALYKARITSAETCADVSDDHFYDSPLLSSKDSVMLMAVYPEL
jgi:hypothetical protein